MTNTRGNTYSRGNRNYLASNQGYWDNSMDELALFDRAAQVRKGGGGDLPKRRVSWWLRAGW